MLACLHGCGPSLPEEAEARSWLGSRSDAIAELEVTLRTELEAIPAFGVSPEDIPCDTSTVNDTLGETVSAAVREEVHCLSQERAALEALNDAVRDLAAGRFAALVGEAGALSGKATYMITGEEQTYSLADAPPAPPGYKDGSVRAAAGVRVGERNLGWGLYQTSWSADGVEHGDAEYHRGIEVESTFSVRNANVALTLFFLTDSAPAAGD